MRGELEAARRRTPEARVAFLEALRLGAGPGDALETAVAHAAYGRFLRRRGERRNAVQQLQIAQDLFTGLGAAPFLARCQAELADCGWPTTHDATEAAQTELTPQELAVARLVAAGRQNREIADELVLSVKTVTYHLGHVYAKLGSGPVPSWQPNGKSPSNGAEPRHSPEARRRRRGYVSRMQPSGAFFDRLGRAVHAANYAQREPLSRGSPHRCGAPACACACA